MPAGQQASRPAGQQPTTIRRPAARCPAVNTGPLKPACRPSRTVTSTEAAHWTKSNRSPI